MTYPRIALLVIGDGRDKLRERTLHSFGRAVYDQPVPHTLVSVDDREHRLGFCGAIRRGWEELRSERDEFDYVFHLEEDWAFDRPVRLDHLARLLESRPDLAQVALRRNAVNADERRAGGLVEMWPDEYREAIYLGLDPAGGLDKRPYLEHRLFFTTNPSLYRAELLDRDWPEGPRCEERFGEALLADGYSFAFWGSRADGPWITHTGTTRTGVGY